jgi:hypothetical protein
VKIGSAGRAALVLVLPLCYGPWAMAQTPSAALQKPYQDRVMQIDPSDTLDVEPETKYDASGLPRTWSLEAFSDSRSAVGLGSSSVGLRLAGYADTLHYGSFSGNVNLQQRNASAGALGSSDSNFVLRQIGMPFDGGWRLDNALGLVNLPVTDLARLSQRVTLSTPAMQGFGSQLRQSDLGFWVAAGRAGQTQGYPVPSFVLSPGSYSMAGFQQQLRQADGAWQWGAMVARAQDVNSVLAQTPAGLGRLDADGVYLSTRREWAGTNEANGSSAQINAIFGRNTGSDLAGVANAPASGVWLEGAFSLGPHRHDWGVFRLDPGLAWLDQPMASDLQGAYWRHAWTTRQWSVQSGLEMLASLTGTTPNGFFASTNARYQYSSSTSFGAGLSARRYGVQAQAVQLYTQFNNDLGSSRAQFDLASAETGERVLRLQFDHDWSTFQAARVTTAVSVDRESRASGDSQGQGVAINADWSIGDRLTLNQSLQGRWSNDATHYSLNAGLTWRIAPRWSLQSNVYAIQGNNNALNLAQSPLVVAPTPPTNTGDSGVFVMLRYEESAGRARAPAGAAPGSAAGRLTGSVFLDDNQNGKREAGEQGAVNVTVLLDGRYSVQTDAQGRFEFPYVAAGPHLLTVISDNLPLPWGLVKDGRTEVRVFTRDTTSADIGATRQ